MTAEDLRKSILQQAIKGKLVPQDPNDEPASVLLERIREEKARLVKEKKIKKDKNESIIYRGEDNSHYEKILATGEVKCIDDEIPFEIPNTWEWVRLRKLIDFSKNESAKSSDIDENAWILDLEDIEKETGRVLQKKKMKMVNSKSDKHIFNKGNVLYSKLRPYLNKVVIADENGYCTSEILAFDFGLILNKYAQIYLMSPYFVDYAMSDAYGVKMPRLGSEQGNRALMPIPPLNEQKRIAQRIEEIQPLIDKYRIAQEKAEEMDKSLNELLKKSILQYAIQGKLVPQIESEEPASVLLERIQQEKLKLVKEGKLKKKDLTDSYIFKGDDNKYYEKKGNDIVCIDDEIPFEIPDSWEWVRGKHIFTPMQSIKPSGDYFTYIDIDAVNNTSNIIDNPKKIPCSQAPSRASRKLWDNSILFSMVRPYLKNIALVSDKYSNAIASTGFYVVTPYNFLYSKYIFNLLLSPYVIDGLNQFMKGDNSPSINNEHIESFLYPIPPYSEQLRIVTALDNVLASINRGL